MNAAGVQEAIRTWFTRFVITNLFFHYGVKVILMRTGNCTGKKHDSCHVGLYT